jgi:hypothetical protein
MGKVCEMLAPSGSSLSQFVDAYHLWDALLLLAVLGVYHFLTIAMLHGFRFLGEVNETYYSYKIRCVENRRRYQQVTAEPVRALGRRPGRTYFHEKDKRSRYGTGSGSRLYILP